MQSDWHERFSSRFAKAGDADCWNWAGRKFKSGYGKFSAGGEYRRAHRLAWEMRNGPIPDGMVVLHSCDNPACVNPAHLSIGTQRDNMRDMIAKGRARPGYVAGEKVGTSLLKTEQVQDIKTKRMSSRKFAALYGVSQRAVMAIWGGVTWKTV